MFESIGVTVGSGDEGEGAAEEEGFQTGRVGGWVTKDLHVPSGHQVATVGKPIFGISCN
jgi:hypothetical protein